MVKLCLNFVQCYMKGPWKTFTNHAQDVLNTFQSFKLDSSSGGLLINDSPVVQIYVFIKGKGLTGSSKGGQTGSGKSEQYFAKYLTNQNLLELQLSDSNFRR